MKNGSLKGNAIYNVINQGCVILFQLITIKYVSSILHSDNYGRINFCNSIVSYFLLFAQMGVSSYMIREGAGVRTDRFRFNKLANQVFTINLFATIISIILFGLTILFWKRLHSEAIILILLGIQIVLNIFNIEWVNNIFEDFKYIAIRNIIIQLISLICIVFLVRKEKDFVIYAAIFSLSASLNYCVNYIHVWKSIKIRPTLHPNLRQHFVPIIILFFNNLAVLIYVNSDITILGILQPDSVVGVYSVSVKIYSVVKRLFQAVIIVSVPRLSNYLINGDDNNFCMLLRKIHDSVLTIVFPMLVGLFMVAENAIMLVSGSEYLNGVKSLRILCVALLFSSLANYYISCVLLPNKKEKLILISTVTSSLINVFLNFLLIPVLSLNGAALTTVLAEILVVIIAYIGAGKYRQTRGGIIVFFKIVAGCIGIILICLTIDFFNFGLIINSVLKILISVFIYLFIEIIVRNYIVIDIIKKLLKSMSK